MSSLLVITEDGFGKRTWVSKYRRQQLGGRGMLTTSQPPLAAAMVVEEDDEFVLATRTGQIVRLAAAAVPVRDRASRGARLVTLDVGDTVATATRVPRNAARIASGGLGGDDSTR